MKRIVLTLFSAIALAAMAGCSKPADETATASPETETQLAAVEPPSQPAPAPAPEPKEEPKPQVALPEGLPAVVHVYPKMDITEVNTLNADEKQYEIKGESKSSVVDVLNYYAKYFRENGWEEDMLMEQPANTVISFKKDGILEYVESQEGGYGCYVTITTGKY